MNHGSREKSSRVRAAGFVLGFFLVAAISTHANSQPTIYSAEAVNLGGDTATGSAESGLLVGTAALPGGESHAFLYHAGQMTDLGTFGGINSGALAIDNNGNILGGAQRPDGTIDAFEYTGGQMIDLGSFGQQSAVARAINSAGSILITAYSNSADVSKSGIYSAGTFHDLGSLGGNFTDAAGFNSSGEVVGGATATPGDSAPEHPFLYSNGQLTDLTNFPGPVGTSPYGGAAVGISDAGLVAGNYYDNGDNSRGFIFDGTATQDIGTLGGSTTVVHAVGAAGQVIGQSANSAGKLNAFLYANGTMTNLGTLDGATSTAVAVNSAGQVAGFSDTATLNQSHAFLFSAGQMLDLGTLGGTNSRASAINASGQVAGTSTLTISGLTATHAFLYSNGAMRDIGSLGGQRIQVNGMNDEGDVVGTASTPGGQNRAYAFLHGSVLELPTLGGDFSTAVAGNSSGVVIGNSATVPGFSITLQQDHAFYYQNGQMLDLETAFSLLAGATVTQAVALNQAGQAIGNLTRTVNGASEQDLFVFQPGHPALVLTPPANATLSASTINSSGDIFGTVTYYGYAAYPFIYSTATGQSVVLNASGNGGAPVAINDAGDAVYQTGGIGYENPVLHRTDGTEMLFGLNNSPYNYAAAMNNADEVVGSSYFPSTGFDRAFLFANGITTDLGSLFPYASQAVDINDDGQVLGFYEVANDPNAPYQSSNYHAFLYTNGSVIDLNDIVTGLPTGWVLNSATFYPGTSDIVATGVYGSRTSEFLLTVPEPASAAFGFLAVILAFVRRPQIAGRPGSNSTPAHL